VNRGESISAVSIGAKPLIFRNSLILAATLGKYLTWTQNSLFEGEITEGLLKQCMAEIASKANPAVDSIYVYRIANPKHIKKVIYGIEKDFESMFL